MAIRPNCRGVICTITVISIKGIEIFNVVCLSTWSRNYVLSLLSSTTSLHENTNTATNIIV
jgi:hypothetical protein